MDSIYLQSLAGGLLIGLAASILLLGSGQVAGISGIVATAIRGDSGTRHWRTLFLSGLIGSPLLWWMMTGMRAPGELALPLPLVLVAGLLVGFGTRRASGCTSGHGVCGLGNLSSRSLVAVAVFMGVAALTVFVTRHLIGA